MIFLLLFKKKKALKIFIGYMLCLPSLLNAWKHILASQNLSSFTVKQSVQAVGLWLEKAPGLHSIALCTTTLT